MGLRSWAIELATPLHQCFFFLEPRCCLLTCVFGVVVLLKHPFQGHFLIGIWQHNLFKYFEVFKLIHDPWSTINRPNTVVWKTSPYHDSLSSQCTMAWIQYLGVIWHTGKDNKTRKELFCSHQSMLRYFSMGQSMCSMANFHWFCTCCFFNNGAIRRLLANSLAWIKRLLTVTVTVTVAGNSSIICDLTGGDDWLNLCQSYYFSICFNSGCSFLSVRSRFSLPF